MKKNFQIGSLLQSRTLLVIEVCIVVFLSVAVGREISRRKDVQSEVNRLDQQIIAMQEQNVRLADILRDMSSDNYAEKEARKRLDMKKIGENVILLPENPSNGEVSVQHTDQNTSSTQQPNPRKWMLYFLGIKP